MSIRPLILLIMTLALLSPAWGIGLANGDFSNGLNGWTTTGSVTDGGGFALLGENPDSIFTEISQAFTIPDGANVLSFRYLMSTNPDEQGGSMIPDAFTAYLLDPVTFAPILSTPGFPDFFYADNTGLTDFGPATSLNGGVVSLHVGSLPSGTNALLAFDLLGSPDGLNTTVSVDDVLISTSSLAVPEPVSGLAICLGISGVAAYLRRRTRPVPTES